MSKSGFQKCVASIQNVSKNKHFLLEKKRGVGGNSKTQGAKKNQKKAKKSKKTQKIWRNRKTSSEIVKNNEFENFA